jgi:hypothetical protein
MNLKKKIILFSVFAVLGFQLLVVIFPYKLSNRQTWPFLNYPMYSNVRYPGDEIILRDLYLTDWSGDKTHRVNYKELHIMNRRLKVLLRNSEEFLSDSISDSTNFKYLNYLIKKNFDKEFSIAKITVRKFIMSENGFEDPNKPLIFEYDWSLNQ